MRKRILLLLPLIVVGPLLLLVLGLGNATIDGARAACYPPAAVASDGFRIGTLNWRGASHYTSNPHPGERPFRERVPHMVSKIDASGASIVGFQEFEQPQADAFLSATDGAWALVQGRRQGQDSTADAIAYQPAAWTVEDIRHVSIHYGRPIIQVPLVRFTSTHDGTAIWVLNTHHPADAVGGSPTMRDAAVRIETRTLLELHASAPDTPLLLTGDMNDRTRFRELFQELTIGWATANPTDDQIDWIAGSPTVTFTDTVVDRTTNDGAQHYTDHPYVHTTATTAQRRDAPTPDSATSVNPTCDTTATTSLTDVSSELLTDLHERIAAMLDTPTGLCELSWTIGAPCTYSNQCPKVVDALYGGTGLGRGYGNGQDVAQGIIDAGLAQSHGTGASSAPPVGAVISYDSNDGVGHVAIYVGDDTIFGNDYGCSAHGVYGCVGFTNIHTPAGSITWALPTASFDLGGMPVGSS